MIKRKISTDSASTQKDHMITKMNDNINMDNTIAGPVKNILIKTISQLVKECCHGRDLMEIGFTTTCAISAYHHSSCEFESRSGEVYLIQHYVIKFVSDLRQVGGFLRVLQIPSPIKLTTTITPNPKVGQFYCRQLRTNK